MQKLLIAITLINLTFAVDKPEIPPIAEFYLKDSKNYESIDKDLKEIIDSEIKKIYEDVRDELYDLMYYGFNKADPVYKKVFKSFDQDAYVSALLNLKSPTEAEAYWLKQQFIDYDEVPFTNVTIKNKTIKIDRKLESQVPVISKKYPSWAQVIKYYGGYSETGKIGVNKQNYKSLFTLTHKYYEIKFIEDGKCLIFSKYLGDEKAFEYYKIDSDSIETKKGKYGLTKIDYDIISGKIEPQIIMQFDKLIIKQDIFEVAPRAKASLKATLNNYDKIITAMFEDLLTEDYNEKIANIHAEKEKERQRRLEEEKERRNAKEQDMAKIKSIRDSLFKEFLNARGPAHEEKIKKIEDNNYDKGSKWKGNIRLKLLLIGRIVDSDGEKVKDAIVSLHRVTRDVGGNDRIEILKSKKREVPAEVRTHPKSSKFKFDSIGEGTYILRAYHPIHGSAEVIIALAEKQHIGDINLSTEHELFKKDWLLVRNKLILNHISSTNKESQFSKPVTSEYIDEVMNTIF